MELKYVLHLYIGCEIEITQGSDKMKKTLKGFVLNADGSYTCWDSHDTGYGNLAFGIKPILRPLSDMTEEEKNEYWFLNSVKDSKAQCEAINTRYLLSKHFDLFNLIPSGQAINKTTL
jgi:hypothetical protein